MNLEKVYGEAPIIEDLVDWLADRDFYEGPATSEIRAALLAAFDRGASDRIFSWILDYPHDAMLALFEATNVDTYGIEWKDGKPVRECEPGEMRMYLAARFHELMTREKSK
jgi:hypothetical protein